jgi:PAS domain S-box-containing protein
MRMTTEYSHPAAPRIGEPVEERIRLAHYQAMVENSDDAIIGEALDGRILSWNPAAERMYAYSAAEAVNQSVTMIVPPERADEWRMAMDRVARGERLTHLETVRLRKDGARLDVRLTLAPIKDAAGTVVGASVIARDISSQKSAAAALALERGMVDTLMDHIPDHIYFKDRQSRFVRINKSMATSFSLKHPDEAVGKTDFDVFTAEHAQQAFQDEQRILQTGEPLVGREEKETWPDGSITWASTTKQCWRNERGEVIGTFGISRDITERRLAEDRLRESEHRLQSILDNTSAVIYMKDRDGRYLLINRQYEELFHVARDRIHGRIDYEIFPQEAADAFRVNDHKALGSDTPLEFEELVPQDDGVHTYLSIKFRLTDGAGAPYAVCGISTDITERKRAEEELKRTATELARSNADLEQFAYAASHDLQEPLRMIASYLQLLERRYRGQLDQSADEFIQFAVEGAKRMQGLINDLLAYSRVGRHGRPFAPTCCAEALKRALANLHLAIADAGATVTYDGLPHVMGDGTQLTQLFQNLVSNSLKFRGPLPPQIHVWARPAQSQDQRPARAWHVPDGRPGEWIITVRDNGIGIDPDHFERIFVIFQRLHGRDQYPGSGIGLSICKKIVERHGGQIWVESEPGHGTMFHFTLPHAEPAHGHGGHDA